MDDIEFNLPFISGNEKKYIQQVFENGHFSGNGVFTKRVQSWLENYLGANRVLLTHSCTAALEMSGLLIDLEPGDEVIMPSFTFVTTASSIMRAGAIPIFCEINDENMQIDFSDAEKRVTSRTKAIIPVHYAGFSGDMDVAIDFCNSLDLIMIEDAAQGLGSFWKDRPLGSFAPLSAISFHETKNIHCGLGGCLVINDDDFVERAEVVWERGTNRAAFFKGLVDKYSWQELGSSFYPSEIQAAFLLAQLEMMEENHKSRGTKWKKYSELLSPLESEGKLRMIRPEANSKHNYHAVAILLQSGLLLLMLQSGLLN